MYCKGVSRFTLVMVNTVFAAFSLISLGIGVWLVATSSQIPLPVDQIHVIIGLFITFSVLCLVVSFIGCFGALRNSKGLLTAYVAIICILLALQIVVVGLAAKLSSDVFRNWRSADMTLFVPYNQLEASGNSTADQIAFSHFINCLHVSLKCCGVGNYADITRNDSAWHSANPLYNGTRMQVPASCCNLTSLGEKMLPRTNDWRDFGRYLPPGSRCPMELADFHTEGCWPTFEEAIREHITTIIIGSVLYVAFYITCITMGCCLIRRFRSAYEQI